VSAWTIGVLLVSGAALELAGIALVGWDVWHARRRLTEMSDPRWLPQQPEESLSHSLFAVMADVAADKTWRRAAGVGLFASGLVVQTVANVAALCRRAPVPLAAARGLVTPACFLWHDPQAWIRVGLQPSRSSPICLRRSSTSLRAR
jgi:hypothetical protein